MAIPNLFADIGYLLGQVDRHKVRILRCSAGIFDGLVLRNILPAPLPPRNDDVFSNIPSILGVFMGISVFFSQWLNRVFLGLWTLCQLGHVLAVLFGPILILDPSQLPDHFIPFDFHRWARERMKMKGAAPETHEVVTKCQLGLSNTSLWVLSRFLMLWIVVPYARIRAKAKRPIGK